MDLPSEEGREQILSVQLKDETLDDSIDLKKLAKKTSHFSGSDLKNLCVAAALTRVKETILLGVLQTNPSQAALAPRDQLEHVRAQMSTIHDWSEMDLEDIPLSLGPLNDYHFEMAFKEVGSSIADEMISLIELRKWNNQYGLKTKAGSSWGFSTETNPALATH